LTIKSVFFHPLFNNTASPAPTRFAANWQGIEKY